MATKPKSLIRQAIFGHFQGARSSNEPMGHKVTDFNMTTGRPRTAQSGFTMVELMVTVLVAAILLVAAVPSFNNSMVSSRLTTQANDLVAAINYARSDAIKRNGSVTLCRTDAEDATACVTDTDDWTSWMVRTAAGDILRRGTVNTYGGKLKVTSDLTDDQIRFGSDGMATTGGASASDKVLAICAKNITKDNFRNVTLGAGSRISTKAATSTCT